MANAPNVLQTFLAHNDAEAGDVIVAFTDDGVLLFQNGRSEVIPLDLCLKEGIPGPNHKLSFDGRQLILNEGVLSSWFLPSNLIHVISIKRGQITRLDRDIEKIEMLGPERRDLRSGSIHYWIRLATEANGTITPFEEATTPSEIEKSSEHTEFSARTIEEESLPSTSREQTDAESLSTSLEYATTSPSSSASQPASQGMTEAAAAATAHVAPVAQPPAASNTPPRRTRSPQRRPVRLSDFMSRQKTPPKSAPPPNQTKASRKPKPNEVRPDAAQRAGRTWARKKEPPRLTRDDVKTQLLQTLEVTGPSPALYQLAVDLDHSLWLKFGAINEDYVVALRNLRKRLKAKGVRDSLLQRQLTPAALVAQVLG